ncbi:hypothetical protein RBR11_07480 [Microbacterium sp. ASV81]|uniref:Uncharacterized protein n=1 Tax=Microbacterium capsulatum TaxID=3041921 RepID=A0ABU0XFC7_9MICO|nr:hypothetical protein [Microbacterium sp. ASV81]MDQ4213756.1 hypothetical protein [Microbacterium sp. ASV81]
MRDRVFSGRILFECPNDQGCADGINGDGVDQSAVEVLAHVQVAELRAPDASTVLDLVGELDLDVFATHPHLQFVHDVGDGLHGVAHVALAELLLGGDQLHVSFFQIPLGDGGVDEVAEHARPHVDDDVLHFRMICDVLHHLLEHRTLRDRLSRLARLDELRPDAGAEHLVLPQGPLSLGCDAVPVFVDVDCGVHLACGRDTQVANGDCC